MKEREGVSYKEASCRGIEAKEKKRQEKIKEYNNNPKKCKYCNSPIVYEKKKNNFCDHSCAASFNNRGKIKNIKSGVWVKKKCLQCNCLTDNIKFCNRDCEQKYKKQQTIYLLEASGELFSREQKWFLIEKREHKCENCGLEKWQNEDIPLDIHHIDGNSDNNKFTNLKLLCPNCHRQTKNYGSKNIKTKKDKRAVYRKKRYCQGLSY